MSSQGHESENTGGPDPKELSVDDILSVEMHPEVQKIDKRIDPTTKKINGAVDIIVKRLGQSGDVDSALIGNLIMRGRKEHGPKFSIDHLVELFNDRAHDPLFISAIGDARRILAVANATHLIAQEAVALEANKRAPQRVRWLTDKAQEAIQDIGYISTVPVRTVETFQDIHDYFMADYLPAKVE